ncbi:hypothetical protein BCN_3219 [Bacillus cereus NC7401]|nr:hypothetical protein BCN_3219 [Bacillus cereus NC7401]
MQTTECNVILIRVFSTLLQEYFYIYNESFLYHFLRDDIIDYCTIQPIKSKSCNL